MEERYSEEELEEAKAYLRDRLRNERSMAADVESLLTLWAGYLLSALERGASDDEIESIIADLVAALLDDCETLAVDEHDRRDAILLYMNGERHGKTLEGRVGERCHTYFNEIAAVYAAGRLLGMNTSSLLPVIKDYMEKPWTNPVLETVREKIRRGEVAGDVKAFESPHFGSGIEIASLGALKTITGFAIADAWMWWAYENALSRGARGYYVVRGSSYPCDECDSHTGIFYPIGDEDNRPQYHLNCCCMVVYSYVDRV